MRKVRVEVAIKEEGQGGESGTVDDGCFQGSAISTPQGSMPWRNKNMMCIVYRISTAALLLPQAIKLEVQ